MLQEYVQFSVESLEKLMDRIIAAGSLADQTVQIRQDTAWCTQKHPDLRCPPIWAKFITKVKFAVCELTVDSDDIRVLEERHYKLVLCSELDRKRLLLTLPKAASDAFHPLSKGIAITKSTPS